MAYIMCNSGGGSSVKDYDYYIENFTPDNNAILLPLALLSSSIANKDFEILFNFTNTAENPTAHCGIFGQSRSGSTSYAAIEFFVDEIGSDLNFYNRRIGNGSSDTVSLGYCDNKDILFRKTGSTYIIKVDGVQVATGNYSVDGGYAFNISNSNSDLPYWSTLGYYSGSSSKQYFTGVINKFGFKWLT